MNNEIKEKDIVQSTQQLITTEVSTSTKDRFQSSKQASDRNWDTQSIMGKKTDIIFQKEDPNWEDVEPKKKSTPSSAKKSRRKLRHSKLKRSKSKKCIDKPVEE